MQFTNLIFLTFLAGLFTTEVFALKSHCTNYFCNGKNAHMPWCVRAQGFEMRDLDELSDSLAARWKNIEVDDDWNIRVKCVWDGWEAVGDRATVCEDVADEEMDWMNVLLTYDVY
ncbi:unnamed protein product [Zymoseptoria tritici ST99CH_1A5]|uniref:Cyanovirin-N domain-containing protein n=1 Tax=Zymoseptoria tritici ST99CH_1A5 TaxID=1276529 RepID=A0A1Y6LKE8_ZYMTR|nr:unnamed protein product [Zymoseptoria tritici ST99CH_1A5]